MTISTVSGSAFLRQALVAACEASDLHVSGSTESAQDIASLESGAVVMIHAIDGCANVSEAVRHLRRLSDTVRILVVCTSDEIQDLQDAVGGQADAVFSEDLPFDVLAASLRLIEQGYRISFNGQSPVIVEQGRSPVAGQEDAEEDGNSDQSSGKDLLTKREAAILQRLREGMANKSIARDLGISEATVKVHLRTIFRKTNVSNRTQAALWAAERLPS